ncbi:putative nucleoredoxin 3 [Vitis vinifera]|uniref:protein-disulfide reductase n=1 Tax=Vitis vinifera TaxID=29760 RepID=A0A438C2A1_VITVI|nr:putative nucleoredoxin 3 [Vitis vinifera]
MAGPDLGVESVDSNDIITVLASEGIEFLLSGEGKVSLSSTEGKMICLFFSANWCRPCRTFTPQLVQIYNSLIKTGRMIEIIFISFDRDETGFGEHFKSMPWLAVPFNVDLHRRLSDHYHVDHIPSFIPLAWMENQLKKMQLGCNIHRLELLQILVSELVGKTIGLYFAAHWCPPCRAFTAQLIEAYNKLVATRNQCFEIIFVSTDRDHQEFDLSLSSDGKTISTNGRAIISSYGAMAFPFTESRTTEIEAALKEEGDALPRQVKDLKHEHILKLDMAKAYVCDSCKKLGRFWAFSCDVCDYDLHPTCVEEKQETYLEDPVMGLV